MAWGTAQQFHGYQRKVQSWVDWSVKSSGDTSCTFTVKGCARSGDGSGYYYAADYAVEVKLFYRIDGGGWVSLGSATGILNYGDEVGRIERTVTIQRKDSNQTVTFATDAVAPYGDWPTATAQLSTTVTKLAYQVPNPPSGCSASRASDSKADVSWSNGSTTALKPRSNVLVEREADGGAWKRIASLSSSAMSYADNGISAGHRYRYRVRSKGAGGTSGCSTSGYVYTTPAAPSSVVAEKTASGILISASSAYAEGYGVEQTVDGGATWQTVAQGVQMPYMAPMVPGTVQFRVRAERGSLASPWALSVVLVTIAPPLAPSVWGIPNPAERGREVTARWNPNHPDGSAQAAAQVEIASDGTRTVDLASETSLSFVPEDAGEWSVRVRTKGLHEDWGAWSDPLAFGVYDAPSVTIAEPPDDSFELSGYPLSIAWEVEDATGVSMQSVAVRGESGTLYSASGVASPISLSQADVSLDNGGSYTVSVLAYNGVGMKSSAERGFTVAWEPPEPPEISVAEGDGASVSVSVAYGGGIPTEAVDVFRVTPDGRWAVAEGVADGDTVTDPLPPIGASVEYEAVARAASGASSSSSSASIMLKTGAWSLSFGKGAQEQVSLVYNPKSGFSIGHGGELYRFADGGAGGGLPVWYGTSDRSEAGTLSFDTEDRAMADLLISLCRRHAEAWIRDPYGHRWRAAVKASFDMDHGQITGVSVAWDAVRFEEAW